MKTKPTLNMTQLTKPKKPLIKSIDKITKAENSSLNGLILKKPEEVEEEMIECQTEIEDSEILSVIVVVIMVTSKEIALTECTMIEEIAETETTTEIEETQEDTETDRDPMIPEKEIETMTDIEIETIETAQ